MLCQLREHQSLFHYCCVPPLTYNPNHNLFSERGSTKRGVGEETIQQQQQRDDVVHRASGVGVPQHEEANAVASGGDVFDLIGVVSIHSDGYGLGGEGGVQRESARR